MSALLLLFSLLLVESRAQFDYDLDLTKGDSGKEFHRLRNENIRLEKKKIDFREKCDKDIAYWTRIYNETYDKLKRDVPEVVEIEQELSEGMAKEAGLDRSLEEMKIMFELLQLKIDTVNRSVEFLAKQESKARKCFEYGHYIGFERKNTDDELEARSGKTRKRVLKGHVITSKQSVKDNITLEQERQNVVMDIMLQQEKFKNVELKEYIAYFTGYCSRKVELLKQLVESLKKWPEAVAMLDNVQDEIRKVNESIANKTSELQNHRDKLQSLISVLMKVQAIYDSRRDEYDCLKKLGDWPIKDALQALTGNMRSLSSFQSYMVADEHKHLALEGVINKYSKVKRLNGKKKGARKPSTFKNRKPFSA